MKYILLLGATFLIYVNSGAQKMRYDDLMRLGKREFKKDTGQNYKMAAKYFEDAVKLKPNSAEAHYYLGYALSRVESNDATNMDQVSVQQTIRASQQFEIVNKLQPKYMGSTEILGPYSKITAEWGSLAFKYWNNNQLDSAIWALKEGRNRGGFSDFIIANAHNILDACDNNAILFNWGDDNTFGCLYIQLIENYRMDVSAIDASMLHTTWYPLALKRKGVVTFNFNEPSLDTLSYIFWRDSTINIPINTTGNYFSWVIKPSYMDEVLLRGNRILLDILSAEKFERPVYFIYGCPKTETLNLESFFTDQVIVSKVKCNNDTVARSNIIYNLMSSVKLANKNNSDEVKLVNNYRYLILKQIELNYNRQNINGVKFLVSSLDKYIPEKEYPIEKGYTDFLKAMRKL
jgi:hypothetical protein